MLSVALRPLHRPARLRVTPATPQRRHWPLARRLCGAAPAGEPSTPPPPNDGKPRFTFKAVKQDDDSASPGTEPSILRRVLMRSLLPAGFPRSVPAAPYVRFQTYAFAQQCINSAGYVLSTHALLTSVGITGAGPAVNATVSWVLKDGLGCLGTVLAAGKFGGWLDRNVKRGKLYADLLFNVGVGLELCTSFFPHHFVLLASLANTLKTLGGMCSGASRAAINQYFAIRGNMADVTAKNQSQSTVGYFIGLMIGVAIHGTCLTCANPALAMLCVFSLTTPLQLLLSFLALRSLPLTQLNDEHLSLLMRAFRDTGALPTPSELARLESFYTCPLPMPSSLWKGAGGCPVRVTVGAALPPLPACRLQALLTIFHTDMYFINFRSSGGELDIDVHLHKDASTDDIVVAVYTAQLFLDSPAATPAHVAALAAQEEAWSPLYLSPPSAAAATPAPLHAHPVALDHTHVPCEGAAPGTGLEGAALYAALQAARDASHAGMVKLMWGLARNRYSCFNMLNSVAERYEWARTDTAQAAGDAQPARPHGDQKHQQQQPPPL